MKINVDCFDKYVELQFPTEDRRLTYGEAEELKNKLTNSLENYQKQRKKTEPKIFDDCVHYRENQTHCEKHFYIYNCRGCKFYKTNPIFKKMSKLDKRLTNLEKVYLMMYDEFDKKMEMLRENNNLFANEIKKVGGFEEDEDDLSPIKEICNAFERVYGKEDENDKKYHLQIKLYKNETPTSYTFVKGFDSHLFNKDVAGSLYDMISTLENDAYNVINKDIEEFVEEYFKKVE